MLERKRSSDLRLFCNLKTTANTKTNISLHACGRHQLKSKERFPLLSGFRATKVFRTPCRCPVHHREKVHSRFMELHVQCLPKIRHLWLEQKMRVLSEAGQRGLRHNAVWAFPLPLERSLHTSSLSGIDSAPLPAGALAHTPSFTLGTSLPGYRPECAEAFVVMSCVHKSKRQNLQVCRTSSNWADFTVSEYPTAGTPIG